MNVKIIPCPSGVLKQESVRPIQLEDNIYVKRKKLLEQRIQASSLDYAVLYGDREHFANIEYFTKYDCRFEEGLFVMKSDGTCWIVAGNEGLSYSEIIPYDVNRVFYCNFSLQGQPYRGQDTITDILRGMGIDQDSRVGLAGYKYYDRGINGNPTKCFDIPHYLVNTVEDIVGESNVVDFTRQLTGLPAGLRMTVRTANEIAFIEYQAVTAANNVRRMLACAKDGMSELEISAGACADLRPNMAFPNILAGERSVQLGLKSPDDFTCLHKGDPLTVSYSVRGSMCARSGMAIHTKQDLTPAQQSLFDKIYEQYWKAIAGWYSVIRAGVSGKALYETVAAQIGAPEFGMELNPGHNVSMDEWTNSPVGPNSDIEIHSGTHMQCDMIAGSNKPVMKAICEDTLVIADEALRSELKAQYPEVYKRVTERQQFMREVLNICISDDVLPMSGLNGVMFPFLLSREEIYALA